MPMGTRTAARRLGQARPGRLRGASNEMPAYDERSPARELVAIVELRILGSVEVADGGLVRDLGGLRERTLLARLLLSAGQVVSAERLAEDLWAGQPPAHWMATLRGYISRLPRALGDGSAAVGTLPPGYRITLGYSELGAERIAPSDAASRAVLAYGPAD